jgi:hypothetical protein
LRHNLRAPASQSIRYRREWFKAALRRRKGHMIELFIGIVVWVTIGTAAALAVGRASAIGAPAQAHCWLARISRR